MSESSREIVPAYDCRVFRILYAIKNTITENGGTLRERSGD